MRCYICNYSDTGENDPLLSRSLTNKVIFDETIGKDVCYDCLGESYEALVEMEDEDIEEDQS